MFLCLAKMQRDAKEGKKTDHGIGEFVFGLELVGCGEFSKMRFVLAGPFASLRV